MKQNKSEWDSLSTKEKSNLKKIFAQGGTKDLITIRDQYNNFATGGPLETAASFVPIIGTGVDIKNFIQDPSWENAFWTVAGGVSDVLSFGSARGALSTFRAAKAARKAAKLRQSARIASALRRGNTAAMSNLRSARKAGDLARKHELEMRKIFVRESTNLGIDAGLNAIQNYRSNRDKQLMPNRNKLIDSTYTNKL